MTLQEIFSNAWNRASTMTHFAAEVTPRAGFRCRYRSEFGPCLIGVSIPDDRYSPALEGNAASTPAVVRALQVSDNFKDHVSLKATLKVALYNIQWAHDGLANELYGLANEPYNGWPVADYTGLLVKESHRSEMLLRLRNIASKYGLVIPGEGGSDETA